MESPFTDFLFETKPRSGFLQQWPDNLLQKSPFTDVPAINENKTVAAGNEENVANQKFETEEMVEHQLAPSPATLKMGSVTFSLADSATAALPEYFEPIPSGNPLLVVNEKDRKAHLSTNFILEELAQSQIGGKRKWNFIRLDPALIDNLQRLRNFIGKSINVIDGYYSPAQLRKVLKINDAAQALSNLLYINNPHITGRGVKIEVPGYTGIVKQIAMAAIVVCDADFKISIGNSTMTLAVKQTISAGKDADAQRITSYIANEAIKVATYNFCIDFKKLLYGQFAYYEKLVHQATASFAVSILKLNYQFNGYAFSVTDQRSNWETPLRNLISLMYEKSLTKNPNVLLYCLAYSSFGYLFRYFFKDKSEGNRQTVQLMIDELTSDNDRKTTHISNSFLGAQQQADKSTFIEYCYARISLGKRTDGSYYNLVPKTFFDRKYNQSDKTFLDKISALIKSVYAQNHYSYNVAPQQLPEGGTKSQFKHADPNPDKPVVDFTGRYWVVFDNDPDLYGRYLVINQAGKFVSGKFGGHFKVFIKSFRKTINEFYGKLDDKGNAICNFYPQQTIILKKNAQKVVQLIIIDNATDKVTKAWLFSFRSNTPVASNQMLKAAIEKNPRYEELLLTLAWVQPLPYQLKNFFESFKATDKEFTEALTSFYSVDENMPSVRKNELEKAIIKIKYLNNGKYLPPMFKQFVNYYVNFFYSVSAPWRPRTDKEFMSKLDWIKRMLADFRDTAGSSYIEQQHKDFYNYYGVETKTPQVLYQYKINIAIKSIGIGPFARGSGTVVIENKTDYAKYPNAIKWKAANNKVSYDITLWNAQLSLNPIKWRPKISAASGMNGEVETSVGYYETDFSGATVEVTEASAFELPVEINLGGVKAGVKTGFTGRVILVEGLGKKLIQFEETSYPGLPDTFEFEPPSTEDITDPKILKFLPSMGFYKGEIDTKASTSSIISAPLPDSFAATYQLNDTRYFKHDDALLSAGALEAIGRMCAEELAAFSDPNSELEIYGHTDASGKPDYNLALSALRAANTLQAIEDRLGNKLKAKIIAVKGYGENEANQKYGQFTQKNAWLRRVVIIVNGRIVLSLGEL